MIAMGKKGEAAALDIHHQAYEDSHLFSHPSPVSKDRGGEGG